MINSSCFSARTCRFFCIIIIYFFGLSTVIGECQLNCISDSEISLDHSGTAVLSPLFFLSDSEGCSDDFTHIIYEENGNIIADNVIKCQHVGQTLIVKIIEVVSQTSCWSSLSVVDNLPPKFIGCNDVTISCTASDIELEMFQPEFSDNCGYESNAFFTDETLDQPCSNDFVKIITRTWQGIDSYNNSATPCTQLIYFETIELNDIDLPDDIILDICEADEVAPSISGSPTYQGNEIDNTICQYHIEYTDQKTTTCGTAFKLFRTWKIIDWCNSDEVVHQQVIEVVDTIAPNIICPIDTLAFPISQNTCLADVSLIELAATDNCSDFTINYNWEFELQNTAVPLGIFPIQAVAIDACGNESLCDFYIETIDKIAPNALCETDVQVSLDEFGNYLLDGDKINSSSFDNCMLGELLVAVDSVFSSTIQFTCADLNQTFQITLMVMDSAENASMCTSQLTIRDFVLPTIECPQDTTIKCYQDPLDLTLTGNAVALDNCQNYEPTFLDQSDLDICNSGTIERTFTISENGIERTCLQLIFLEVDTPSVVFPADITVSCGEIDDFSIAGQPIVTAMCPGFNVGNNDEIISTDGCMITTKRVWKVLDHCLDSLYQADQIVVEIDTTAPVIILPASEVTIQCTQTSMQEFEDWLQVNGNAIAEDACGEVSWTNNFEAFDNLCGNTGTAEVIFIAIDPCGNSIQTQGSFTIIDTIGPMIITPPLSPSLSCEDDLQAMLNDYLNSNGGIEVVDACSSVEIETIIENPSNSNCSEIQVSITAMDECGNSVQTTATITIEDEESPVVLQSPNDIMISCDSEDINPQIEAWLTIQAGAVATDNCGEITWSNTFAGIIPPCGVPVDVVFTATDFCDNTTQVSATYTIIDDQAPILSQEAIDVTYECDGFGNVIDINDFLSNNGFAEAADNCGEVIWMNDYVKIDSICAGTGNTTVTFTASDVCGNSTTTQATITIIDTTPPEVILVNPEFTVECDGGGNVLDFNTWVQNNGNATVNDICGEVEFVFDFDVLNPNCGNTGNVFTVFGALDECGNRTNIITNFVIEDTTPPQVNCPDDIVQLDEGFDCNEFIILPPTTAIDICNGILFFSYEIDFFSDGEIDIVDNGPNASGDYPVGIHTVNYFVEDECGNMGVCQQLIQILDNTNPTVDCVNEFILGIDTSGIATLLPEEIGMGTDSCSTFDVEISQTEFTCDDCGIQEVTFNITDTDGNISSCTSNLFVCDLGGNCTDCPPCGNLFVGGMLQTENNICVEGVELQISEDASLNFQNNPNGSYYFEGAMNESYSIAPNKNDDPKNGVTTLDLIAIQQHIIGQYALNSPYQMIAADANNSGSITTVDIVEIQRLILQVITEFSNNTSWRFVDDEFKFMEDSNPFMDEFPEQIVIDNIESTAVANNFVAIKIGDVNQTAVFAENETSANRTASAISLEISDSFVSENETIEISLNLGEQTKMKGYQFALKIDPNLAEMIETTGFGLDGMNSHHFNNLKEDGILLTNWVNPSYERVENNTTLFTLKIKAKRDIRLSEVISITESRLTNEVYLPTTSNHTAISSFELNFTDINNAIPITGKNQLRLFQNIPNPFNESTTIPFYLPKADEATINIYDTSGRLVWTLKNSFPAGNNEVSVAFDQIRSDGIFICELNTASENAVIKMTAIFKP